MGMSATGSNSGSYIIDGAISSQNSIAFNPKHGDVAYIAGAFVVIYSMKTSKQERFLKGERQRAFQCIAYSPNGKYLAAADNFVRLPEISIWLLTVN